jgi:hypothetical protein
MKTGIDRKIHGIMRTVKELLLICLLSIGISTVRGQSGTIAFDTTGKLTQLTQHKSLSLPKFELAAPMSLPLVSLNGIKGSWSPAMIKTGTIGATTYTFTPDPGQSAASTTVSITIADPAVPIFKQIDTLLKDSPAPLLPQMSTNGISGSWNQPKVNTAIVGTTSYTFKSKGKRPQTFSMNITVVQQWTPYFNFPRSFFQFATPMILPTISANAITGRWSPSSINTLVRDTKRYTFTPDPGQHATVTTMDITIIDMVDPEFDAIPPSQQYSVASRLPIISHNGIIGTWDPAIINTAVPGSWPYVFTPDPGQHAKSKTVDLEVYDQINPVFPPPRSLLLNSVPPSLQSTSLNGITGTWIPERINTAVAGVSRYYFTPDPGQGAVGISLNILVTNNMEPTFTPFEILQNAPPPPLPPVSLEGIPGDWNPANVDATNVGSFTYHFTPHQMLGVNPVPGSLIIKVNAPNIPKFKPIGPFSQKIASPSSKDFLAQDATIKKTSRDILLDRIASALALLDPQNTDSLHQFIILLWGANEVENLRVELTTLTTSLSNNDASSIAALNQLAPLSSPLRGYLLNSSSFIYSVVPEAPSGWTMELHRKSPFNQFLLDLYNGPDPLPKKPIISIAEYIRDIQYLRTKTRIGDSLARLYNPLGMDPALVNEMQAFSAEAGDTLSRFTAIYNLLNSNWYKYWFWVRGGQIRLNPLDFSTDNLLNFSPQYVLNANGDSFNEYIDSVIRKYKLYDTVGKVDAFRKILALKGSGNVLYYLKARLDSLTAANAQNQALYTITDQTLNSVQMPAKGKEEAKKDYYIYSVSSGFKTEDNDPDYLSRPIFTDSIKRIVVVNLPTSSKLYLKENAKGIVDQSSFEAGVGNISALIIQAAAAISQYSTPLGAISTFLTAGSPVVNKLAPKPVLGAGLREGSQGIDLKSALYSLTTVIQFPVKYLKDNHIYIDRLYREIHIPHILVQNANKLVNDLDGDNDQNQDETIITALQTVINDYLRVWKRYAKTVQDFNNDRLMADNFLEIFTHSTLPADKLSPTTPKAPLLSSKILTTTTVVDSAIQKYDTLYSVTSSDTNKIDQFKYKTGKTYRFQLSAGISYVAADYVQTKVATTNGQLSVSNSAQQYRFLVGLHVYLGKGLFLQDNRAFGRLCERSSLFFGVGFPNPLENLYLGYSYDIWPGFKAVCGAYFFRNDRYTIQNNQVIEDQTRYNGTGPFFAIQIDPTSLLKALGFSK